MGEALDDLEVRVQKNQREWSLYNTENSYNTLALQQAVSTLFRQFCEPLEKVSPERSWMKRYAFLASIQDDIMEEAVSMLKVFEQDFNEPLKLLVEARDEIMCKVPARWTFWVEFNVFLMENSLKIDLDARNTCLLHIGDRARDMRDRVYWETYNKCRKLKRHHVPRKSTRRLLSTKPAESADECPLLYMGLESQLGAID